MTRFCILIATLLVSSLLHSQSVLHYDFTNSTSEVHGNGPELIVLGNSGFYVEDTLGEVGFAKKWVYRFEENSGLQFDNTAAGNFLGENYTIELYFVFDALNSWKRVVDWKNRKTDYGAYVYNGELNFYPYVYSGEAPVVVGEYTYYVITRNGETQELIIYTDAQSQITLTDSFGDALLDDENVLNVFHDDLVVPNEASSGAVAMLKLYNYTLDSTTIKNNWDDLAGNIFSIGEQRKINTTIETFPNPAQNCFFVNLSNFKEGEPVTITLVNTTGITVFKDEADTGQKQIKLNVADIQNGIYVLIAESRSKRASEKVIIRR